MNQVPAVYDYKNGRMFRSLRQDDHGWRQVSSDHKAFNISFPLSKTTFKMRFLARGLSAAMTATTWLLVFVQPVVSQDLNALWDDEEFAKSDGCKRSAAMSPYAEVIECSYIWDEKRDSRHLQYTSTYMDNHQLSSVEPPSPFSACIGCFGLRI